MRLIDADKLLHQGYDYVVDGIAYDSCNKSMDIEDIPTAQAISLAKVKQAKEEINKLLLMSKKDTDSYRAYYNSIEIVNMLMEGVEE